ncbi:hypothetical protein OHE93_24355, partial [Escherichia coli]|uniref:hypothetical protein n=1 Tax=Escherichia coli TaxID=562 RepID=UPI0021E90DA6
IQYSHYRKFTSQPQHVLAYDVPAVSTPASPPFMIGQYQYSTSKNRKLAVSAEHRPSDEGTKKIRKEAAAPEE